MSYHGYFNIILLRTTFSHVMNLAPQVIAALIGVVGVALTLLVNRLLLDATRRHEKNAVITAVRSDIRSIVYAVD
jgi:hypothetical protein